GAVIPGATAADNCGGNLTGSIVVTGAADVNTPGAYTVHYNVSDASGNAAVERTRSVTVVDTTAPNIACPANITRTCTSSSGAQVTFTVNASDACDSSLTVGCTPASGSTFTIGTTTVTCTATDHSGNHSGCSFSVT